MKTPFLPASRFSLLAGFAALLLFPSANASSRSDTSEDRAAQLLARQGAIPLSAVGDYVEPGTYRMQVRLKLGEPDLRLADGTWLYQQRQVNNSRAQGTVVVRFGRDGRVSSLALVTPSVATALRAAGGKDSRDARVANR